MSGRLIAAAVAVALLLPAAADGAYEYVAGPNFGATDGTQGTGTATCDAGDIAIGGGVNVGTNVYENFVYLNTSRPEPGADPIGADWLVYVDNYTGGATNHLMNAYAVCDTSGKPENYAIRTKSTIFSDGKQKGAVAKCKGSEVVVGGGGRSSGFYVDETYLSTSAPVDGKDKDKHPDDGWEAVLNDDEGGETTSQLDVFAICDRKHKTSDFRYETRSEKVKDADVNGVSSATCGNDALVGGGVSSAAKYKHGVYISSTFPFETDNKWFSYVANYETPDGDARKVTATSICKR